MKKSIYLIGAFALLLTACNNEANDSVETADSINSEKADTSAGTAQTPLATDKESADFLVQAADGGMAEVALGVLAEQKAKNADVKSFATMMVRDHSGANDKVQALAARRNVTLPDSVSNDHKKTNEDLAKKSGADFDKAYVKEMVKGHEKTVDLFKKAAEKVNDAEVKTFASNTLPTLQQHLDSIKAIQKKIK